MYIFIYKKSKYKESEMVVTTTTCYGFLQNFKSGSLTYLHHNIFTPLKENERQKKKFELFASNLCI